MLIVGIHGFFIQSKGSFMIRVLFCFRFKVRVRLRSGFSVIYISGMNTVQSRVTTTCVFVDKDYFHSIILL